MKVNKYAKIQIERSDAKWYSAGFFHNKLKGFQKIAKILISLDPDIKAIGCMGIRSGNEYDAFKVIKGYKDTKIYGIDINSKVEAVGDNCYCFDFSNLPKEWENKFDLVYSNSLDHALDLNKTIGEFNRVTKKYIWLDLPDHETSETDIHTFDIKNANKLFKGFEIIDTWPRGNTKGYEILLKKTKI